MCSRRIALCALFLATACTRSAESRSPTTRQRAAIAPSAPPVRASTAASASAPAPTAPLATSTATTNAAPTTAPTPIPEHANELARVLAIAKSHGVAQGSGWTLKQQACIEIFGVRCKKVAQFEEVFVALRAKGRALEVDLVSSCYGDSCSFEAWLYTDVRPPRKVQDPPFVVAPDLSWLIFDQITMTPNSGWDSRLARLDLVTGATAPFADCVSPSLSPGEKWIACRTNDGSVYRVPVAGGTATLVHQGTGAIVWIPYAHAFPPPVSFPSPTKFAFEGNNDSLQVLAWTE